VGGVKAGRSGAGSVAAALVLALALVLGQAVLHQDHWVDDAFIGFRYAANLAAGAGPVWHPGDPPVEGITNLGWVLVLAGLAGFGSLPVVAKGLGLAALAGTLVGAVVLHRRLMPEAGVVERAALPLLLAAQPELVYFSLAGMETGLTAFVTVLAVFLALGHEARPRAVGAGLGLVAVVLFLLRPEMLLLPPFLLLFASLGRDRRGLGTLLLVAMVGIGCVTAWRWATFGAALPNTFAAKAPGTPADLAGRALLAPLGGLVNLPPPFGLGLAGLVFGAWRLTRAPGRARDLVVALVATGVCFAVYARPDWTAMGRYFAPFVPLASLLLLRGIAVLALRVSARRARVVIAGVALLLVGQGFVRHARYLTGLALGEQPGFVLVAESLVAPARRFAAQMPPDATVACRRIGVLGFSTPARVFDFAFGLTEPEVARQLRRSRVAFFDNARTPALAELWRSQAPDYLVEDWTRLERWLVDGESARHFRIHGLPYEVIDSAPIAEGRERWVLARRIVGEAPGQDDWRAAAERVGPRDPLRPN
jgi:hypothetical protein